MAKLLVTKAGINPSYREIDVDRLIIGRDPECHLKLEGANVSKRHAAIYTLGNDDIVEDLGSTNGTYVNAKAVKRQELRNGDTVEVGKYKIRFLQDAEGQNFEKTMIFKPGMVPPVAASARPAPAAPAPAPISAVIRVMSGAAAGREVSLQKVVTTIGKPGVAVASITKRHQGFVLAHVEGPEMPLLNGAAIGASPVPLKHGDRLELAGTEMQFEQT